MTIENNELQIIDADEFREEALDALEENIDNPKRDDTSYNYNFFNALGDILENYVERRLQEVYNAATVDNAEGENLTQKAAELGVFRNEATTATGVVEFYREDEATTNYPIEEGTKVQTAESNPLQYETIEDVVLEEGENSVTATIESVDGGAEYNVPAHRVTVMTSPPSGIDGVTNNVAIGDNSFVDTQGNSFEEGTDREEDEELRSRTFNARNIGGAATSSSIESALLDVEDVEDASVITNPTPNPNNNLDPYSSEVIVVGGGLDDVAETLYDTMSITDLLRLEAGANGNAKGSYIKYSSLLEDEITIPISSANIIQLQIEIDCYYKDSEYVGDDQLKDNIVEAIGGTKVNGSYYRAGNIGEDVHFDRVESAIAHTPKCRTGVYEIDDIRYFGDNVEYVGGAISVDSSSIARVDAEDITINANPRNY